MNFIIEWLNIDQHLKQQQVRNLFMRVFLLKEIVYVVRNNRLTSSYRQRLSRYRELRSRTPTAGQSQSEIISAVESSTETIEEGYIMINSQEILRLIEV